jgi:hypothetical protein
VESIEEKLTMTGAKSLGIATYELLRGLFTTALALAYLDMAETRQSNIW